MTMRHKDGALIFTSKGLQPIDIVKDLSRLWATVLYSWVQCLQRTDTHD